ncbi:MAG: thioredoxin-disulfide reductase [Oscillospiraceae bacterium]|nr:thioredoxin-disulfide reductase [Oscillospiraceae bacterium]
MKHTYDMLIIGGGPAGYTAALYAARAGLDAVLIERMSAGGQMTLTGDIDNYPGFDEGIDGFTLGMKMQNGAERFGAKTEYAEVLSVDFSGKIKKTETTNGTYLSRTVVIAAGANPRELGIENEQALIGSGVHYCAHCDGRFYKGKTVAVIGGGNSAAADALYLSRLAKKVYVVHRRDTLRAEKIYHEPLMKAENVEFVWNSIVTEFIADEKVRGLKIKNVRTDETAEIICDGVFISIGRKPATDFLKGAVQLDSNGYIIADETTRTSVDGVFAAGDIRTKALRQVVTAAADGAVAVHFAEKYLMEE